MLLDLSLHQLPLDSEQRALLDLLLELHFQMADKVVALGLDLILSGE